MTVTDDLNASFPAEGVRSLDGWSSVPLMCAREIPVPGSLPRCLRALLLVNWASDKMIPQPVYLGEAIRLRPDLRERPTRTGA
ncbi:MAG: chorismate mutase [Firmicutes bacterium]|nr:chorismate mutase [Bacillota bacterium]